MLLDGVFMCILTPLMKLFHWDPVLFGVMTAPFLALGVFTAFPSITLVLPRYLGLMG